MEQLGSHWTDFHQNLHLRIFYYLSRKLKSYWNVTSIAGTLHEDLHRLTTISRPVLLRMRNVSDKFVETIKTRFMWNNIFRKSCCLWCNVSKNRTPRQAMDGNIIGRMRFASWISMATDTHREHEICIALQLQQWLRERFSMILIYVHWLSC